MGQRGKRVPRPPDRPGGQQSLGHCHPRVVEAIREQAGRLIHAGNLFYTEPALRLAERLATSSLRGAVHFANSGTEANEAALKMARKAKPGGDVVSVARAFHGRTYGSLSATPQESKQAAFAPLVPGFRSVEANARALAAAVDERTAAVILEPVQGEGGVHVLPGELLRAAREACDTHGAALIFDEVQCGMGRTGTLWAYEHDGVDPRPADDGQGARRRSADRRARDRPAPGRGFEPGDHGSTFAGNPVACAAALAAFDVIDDAALLARVRERGELLAHQLAELPRVREVRGRGFMLAAELDGGGAPELVARALSEQRLVLNATGPETLRVLPPLVISDAELDDALGRLRVLLEAA